MSKRPPLKQATLALAAATLAPAAAAAQDAPPADVPAPAGGEEAPPVVVQVPAPPPPQVVVPGYPQPGVDINEHLPSSSRGTLDTGRSTDGFDLGGPRGGAGGTLYGSESGSFVESGSYVPETYSVKRGDTLWDISSRFYDNPYNWPRLWAMNAQIQNPHWIYPGDRLRLRQAGAGREGGRGLGLGLRRGGGMLPGTVFLREQGWVDDPKRDAWGRVVGSPDDQMLLSVGDDVYLELEKNRRVEVGQVLQIFRPLKVPAGEKGELVSVRGAVRVDRVNPKTHMARAKVIEALDVIERGAKVGPVEQRFDVVAPTRAAANLEAKILGSVYPHRLYGQHMVVFLDRGAKDGVRPGNRLFAVRRGDPWRESVDSAGNLATLRPRVEDDRPAKVDGLEDGVDADLLPDETYAELRVLRVRDRTSAAIVVASKKELERDARIVMKRGY